MTASDEKPHERNLKRLRNPTASVTLLTVLLVTACETRPPVYTDASPPKLQRACQAVDEATGVQMTEMDRIWCQRTMQAWYSEKGFTRPDPADQFTGTSQLRYLQTKAIDCCSTADDYRLIGTDRWEAIMRCLVIMRKL